MKLSNSLKDLSSGQLHLFVNVLLDREKTERPWEHIQGHSWPAGSSHWLIVLLGSCVNHQLCTSCFSGHWNGPRRGGVGWGGQGDSALSAGGLVCTWDRVTPERRQRAAFIILSALTRREAEPLSIGVVRQKLKSCGRDTRTDAVTSPREIITDTQWIWIGGCSSCENGH